MLLYGNCWTNRFNSVSNWLDGMQQDTHFLCKIIPIDMEELPVCVGGQSIVKTLYVDSQLFVELSHESTNKLREMILIENSK